MTTKKNLTGENLKILYDSPYIIAATTLRGANATDNNPYSGFSLCHYTGDSPEHIANCRKELSGLLGIAPAEIIVPRQTHSVNIAYVDKLSVLNPSSLENVDALITKERDLAIGVNTADCLPIVLADKKAGIIAVVHAGWRGAVRGIIEKTLESIREMGADDITAWLAPAIGAECFEVGEEVAIRFPEKNVLREGFSKPHIDLAGFAVDILRSHGVEVNTDGFECTRCNPRRYFSARAVGTASGRNFTFAMLKTPR